MTRIQLVRWIVFHSKVNEAGVLDKFIFDHVPERIVLLSSIALAGVSKWMVQWELARYSSWPVVCGAHHVFFFLS